MPTEGKIIATTRQLDLESSGEVEAFNTWGAVVELRIKVGIREAFRKS
jgi:hypothetical protein